MKFVKCDMCGKILPEGKNHCRIAINMRLTKRNRNYQYETCEECASKIVKTFEEGKKLEATLAEERKTNIDNFMNAMKEQKTNMNPFYVPHCAVSIKEKAPNDFDLYISSFLDSMEDN